ncbi:putative L-type lectin-domain containing receptor kinase V.2 [Portunus trituberculatus]|uniref:Putative L-type lectin-domain containing receptor kinase V.2 n=1 Tax=Portunus trituberculatus TaxID=210409 RepID=A0A5B7FPD0_PORTR|nr:putative L-type lectin-domain containing receptor kinase V.2 [Portunus trituberculatus]
MVGVAGAAGDKGKTRTLCSPSVLLGVHGMIGSGGIISIPVASEHDNPRRQKGIHVLKGVRYSNDRITGASEECTEELTAIAGADHPKTGREAASTRKPDDEKPSYDHCFCCKHEARLYQERQVKKDLVPSRKPAKKRRAEASPHQPKKLKKESEQRVSVQTPKRPLQQGGNTDEERARHYLAHLGVRLLKEKTVRKMISFGSQDLGAGSYGSCCKGVDPYAGKELVIKTFLKDDLRSLVTETRCLQRLQGHGMQRLVGVCVETRQLVTRFAGQTAEDYFHSGTCFTQALSVILQVARAVRSVNEAGYTHNDIKDNNVCVKECPNGPKATIIDLGLAKRVGSRGFYKTDNDIAQQQRKYPWIAPELMRDSHPCSAASDVYSVAWFILHVPALRDRPVASPAMWLFMEWMMKARRPLPEQRPSLDALIPIIRQLQTEMANEKI